MASKNYPPAEQASRLAEEMSKHSFHPRFIRSFQAMSVADPRRRYEMLKLGARDDGRPDWDCPEAKRILEDTLP